MDIARLIMLSEQNELTLLNLLEWEEEFEETVESFRLSYERRRNKRRYREKSIQRTGTFWDIGVPSGSDEDFKNYFHFDKPCFLKLVQLMKGLKKNDTNLRKAIPIKKRIAIALYTMANATDYKTIAQLFGVSSPMVSNILSDFCKEVKRVLSPKYFPEKFLTQQKLEECVKGFEAKGFPQCFGAIGHLQMRFHSLVALVDYRGRFLYLDYGGQQEAHAFEGSPLKQFIDSSPLFQNNSRQIAGMEVPVLLLGDSLCRLSPTVMTPYSTFENSNTEQQIVFNEALQKARHVVEQAIQELQARFQRIGRRLESQIKSRDILQCSCILHNFLNSNNSTILTSWQDDPPSGKKEPGQAVKSSDEQAESIRQAISQFFEQKQS